MWRINYSTPIKGIPYAPGTVSMSRLCKVTWSFIFILKANGSHWMLLRRDVTQSDGTWKGRSATVEGTGMATGRPAGRLSQVLQVRWWLGPGWCGRYRKQTNVRDPDVLNLNGQDIMLDWIWEGLREREMPEITPGLLVWTTRWMMVLFIARGNPERRQVMNWDAYSQAISSR